MSHLLFATLPSTLLQHLHQNLADRLTSLTRTARSGEQEKDAQPMGSQYNSKKILFASTDTGQPVTHHIHQPGMFHSFWPLTWMISRSLSALPSWSYN